MRGRSAGPAGAKVKWRTSGALCKTSATREILFHQITCLTAGNTACGRTQGLPAFTCRLPALCRVPVFSPGETLIHWKMSHFPKHTRERVRTHTCSSGTEKCDLISHNIRASKTAQLVKVPSLASLTIRVQSPESTVDREN